jgi:hypothetical protein
MKIDAVFLGNVYNVASSPLGDTAQNNNIDIFTGVRTSNRY